MLCADALSEVMLVDGLGVAGAVWANFLPDNIHPGGVDQAVYEDMSHAWNSYAGPSSAATARIQIVTRSAADRRALGADTATRTWLALSRIARRDVTVTTNGTERTVRILGVDTVYPPALTQRDAEERFVYSTELLVGWNLPAEILPGVNP